jgi:hypothetical protein
MQTIELSDPTYRLLLGHALSFGDTAEDVILRLLEHPDGSGSAAVLPDRPEPPRRGARATPGSILPVRAYWKPILALIVERGGSAPASDVIDALELRMKDMFMPRDLEQLDAGEIRWRNRARFARLRMTQQGLLSNESHRGMWELTDVGREFLETS